MDVLVYVSFSSSAENNGCSFECVTNGCECVNNMIREKWISTDGVETKSNNFVLFELTRF